MEIVNRRNIGAPSDIKKHFLIILLAFLFGNMFVFWFIRQEAFIYYWDYSNYWDAYQRLGMMFRDRFDSALWALLHSIRHDDYNLLPTFFLIPFNSLFGNGRLAYILAITNVYAIPSAILFGFVAARIHPSIQREHSFSGFSISLFILLLAPQFWNPLLYGYVDVAGLVGIYAVILIYLRAPVEEQQFRYLIAMGALLCALVLTRRWYSYWVVSFFLALGIERGIFLLLEYRTELRSYWPTVRNIAIVGSTAGILFFLIATPLAKRILVTDYSEIYSAYKFSQSSAASVSRVIPDFGWVWICLFAIGAVQCVLNNKTRSIASVLLLQLVISYVLFSRTQDFGTHHLYLLISNMAVFVAIFMMNTWLWLIRKVSKGIFLCVSLLLIFFNFAIVFVPRASHYLEGLDDILCQKRHYPLVRTDLGNLDEIINILDDLNRRDEGDVYVLASSSTLNDDILRHAVPRDKQKLKRRIIPAFHVDKRDGFPYQFLACKYVVVADPIQYHLRPEDQRVIGVLASQILTQSHIGAYYLKLSHEVMLGNGAKVYIYQKTKPFHKADLESLSTLFAAYYPERKASFEIANNICGMIVQQEIGDLVGCVSCGKDILYVQPGTGKPTVVHFDFQGQYRTLKMAIGFRDPDRIASQCGDGAGEVNLTFISDGVTVLSEYVTHKQHSARQLDITGVDTLEVIVERGKNGPDCDWFLLKDLSVN
jgi:hypothetical protein